MAVNLRIRFTDCKRVIESQWIPVVFELKDHQTGERKRFVPENIKEDIKDDPGKRSSYFDIQDLQEGSYTLTVLDFHKGHPIISEPNLELRGNEVEYEFGRGLDERDRQVNTYAMDLVVDAPCRLENSYPYLPIIIYIKDIDPGDLKIFSIDLYGYTQPGFKDYVPLNQECIYRVLDRQGQKVEENGLPAVLRFDNGRDWETVRTDPWYRIILVHKDKIKIQQGKLLAFENAAYLQYMLKVRYEKRSFLESSKQFVLRTLLPGADLPTVSDWYYGDTHYHSEFTDNPYEYGGPLSATAEMAKAVGLSWVTVTDHSYGLSRPNNQDEELQGNRWAAYKEAIRETNSKYQDVLLVGAEEITVRKSISGLHLLSYDNPFIEDEHPFGFGSLTLEEVLNKIMDNSDGETGFIYAAHPASKGYKWKGGEYDLVKNPAYYRLFAGLQIFNEKILYRRTTRSTMDQDVLDALGMFDEDDRQKHWSKELDKGINEHWREKFLKPALSDYRQTGDLKKHFILAGSDAHMDFNYAFRPHPVFLIHHLYDNAFGKVRTLAYLPERNGRSLTEENIYKALKTGKTLLTDGPVALFFIRRAGSNQTSLLGDTLTVTSGDNLELTLEWCSTTEFGPIEEIKLILGTEHEEKDISGRIDLSSLREDPQSFQGRITHIFPDWTESPCYLRLEASSAVDPETGKGLFRCITNPIWIVAE